MGLFSKIDSANRPTRILDRLSNTVDRTSSMLFLQEPDASFLNCLLLFGNQRVSDCSSGCGFAIHYVLRSVSSHKSPPYC